LGLGGKREGAGRKKGFKFPSTLTKEAQREELRQIVSKHMREMVEAQIAASKGTKYLVYRNKQGGEFRTVTKDMIEQGILEKDNVTIEVWDKQPSTPAFTDLMNRALDKPKEQPQEIDLTVKDARADRVIAARERLGKRSA
jgi:hypothetical protein